MLQTHRFKLKSLKIPFPLLKRIIIFYLMFPSYIYIEQNEEWTRLAKKKIE